MKGKRDLSIFDAIEELETQDRRADGKRRKKSQTDARRAVEVQSQTKIYHHLVESRILLQRAIKSQQADEKLDESDATFATSSSSFRDTCNTLLETLLQARCSLWKQGNGTPTEETSAKYNDSVTSSSTVGLHETLQAEYDQHKDGWKEVLNSRHKSLRLHSGVTAKSQFKVMDSSFWQQVEASIEYEEIRANDTKRGSQDTNNNTAGVTKFDDSKLYQQLLKDFVANSTSTAEGGSAAAAERLRKSRSKNAVMKDVDRRASKGRKIRYKEIPKLVNFTFPLSRPSTSHLDQDAYFQSLFGGVAAQGRKI
jgi:protein AATF/BFR2